MKHIENTSRYKADEGCFIVRKADGFIMGEGIDLGSADNIDNYEDKEYTEEEYKAFYEKLGRPSRKDMIEKRRLEREKLMNRVHTQFNNEIVEEE